MGVSGQLHAPAALYPRERAPGTHWMGGWVGLEPSWMQWLEEKYSAPIGDLNPDCSDHSQTLYCLSYRSSNPSFTVTLQIPYNQ
jgi:hypothetical protein